MIKIEIQVLKNNIVINSSSPGITKQIINLLKQFGINIDVEIEDVRCG